MTPTCTVYCIHPLRIINVYGETLQLVRRIDRKARERSCFPQGCIDIIVSSLGISFIKNYRGISSHDIDRSVPQKIENERMYMYVWVLVWGWYLCVYVCMYEEAREQFCFYKQTVWGREVEDYGV